MCPKLLPHNPCVRPAALPVRSRTLPRNCKYPCLAVVPSLVFAGGSSQHLLILQSRALTFRLLPAVH